MTTSERGSPRRAVVLLAAMLVSLILAILGGYLTRLSLIEASSWALHTCEVKLAIAECVHALDHDDAAALRSAEAKVERLTVDNPHQQQNVARAQILTGQKSPGALEDIFATMQREEDRLMTERMSRIDSARVRSSSAFLVGAMLTFVFGVGAFAWLRAQRLDLARQRALLESILESVDEGIIAIDTSLEMIAINAVARSMWNGSAPNDRWPEDWGNVLRATYEDGSVMKPEDGPLARALRGDTSKDVVYRVMSSDPTADHSAGLWVSASARPIRDDLGRTIAAVTTLRNISEQRAQAERLRNESLTDELTGLFNRRGFLALANARIAEAGRTKAPMALLYADVNGLKRINDALGHEQGDRVIEDAARTLRGVLRGGDIVARIGGDEFVALLPNFSPASREPLLERLAAAIRANAEEEGLPYRLSVSIGVTFMDWERGQSLDELLAEADRKMYERKQERAGQSSRALRASPRRS